VHRCTSAQELCGLSKHLQVNNRGLLLTNLNNLGLFEVRCTMARGCPTHMVGNDVVCP